MRALLKRCRLAWLAVVLGCGPAWANGDDEPASRVVVLANTAAEGSSALAQHYAHARGIPGENIVGLPMPVAESITWQQFLREVYEPLQRALVERGWIDAEIGERRDQTGRPRLAIQGHRVAYLVVCRGVPLKIAHDPALFRPLAPMTDRAEFRTTAAAVDSELSLIAAGNYPIAGFVMNPFFQRERTPVVERYHVIKVSRLDGASDEDARGLVDAALKVEAEGLIGRAYVDLGGPHKTGDAWLASTVRLLEEAGFAPQVDRAPKTFPTTARFDRPALYFGWYDAQLSGPMTRRGFRFAPGAVALHIHSFSARTLSSSTGGWTAPLVARGAAATVGNVNEPYLDFTHHPHLLLKALLRGDRWGDAVYYSLRGVSWQAIAIGDPLYRPFKVDFARQWERRSQLDTEARAYVTLRELERLLAAGQPEKALAVGTDPGDGTPAHPAVQLARLRAAAAAGNLEQARVAGEAVLNASASDSERPLALEAAEALGGLGQAATALEWIGRQLEDASLRRSWRLLLLERGAVLAQNAGEGAVAEAWAAERERLRAPAQKKEP